MTTEGGGKLSPWLQLCGCVGTQGREVQCVPVSGPQAAEAVGTGRAAVPVGNSSARESAVCAHTRACVCVAQILGQSYFFLSSSEAWDLCVLPQTRVPPGPC